MNDNNKIALDLSALTVTAASFVDVLPSITALASLIWVLIRIWETDTVKGFTGRLKD